MAQNSRDSQPLDDPFYYLNNFRQVLDWLELRYADVMSESEHGFIRDFKSLPRASQGLLVRMVMRKGVHFRLGKLNYTEIGDISDAAQPLLSHGWLDDQARLTVTEVFDVLLKAELLQTFGSFIEQPKGRKDDWLPTLAEQFTESRSLSDWAPTLAERLLSLTIMDLCDRLRLMFFGNLYQDWSEFVLADLGIFTYEKSSSAPTSAACAAVKTSMPACSCITASCASKPVSRCKPLLNRSARCSLPTRGCNAGAASCSSRSASTASASASLPWP